MTPVLFDLSSAEGVAGFLCRSQGWQLGQVMQRQFPDGESYVRLLTPVTGRDVIFLCTLDRPDPKIPPLLFAAAAARKQGARMVGMIAPYLAYMRQDRAFQEGEAVTSETFAETISARFDWLVTVDPHLHRHANLGAIYSIPSIVATATDAVAEWIRATCRQPVLIGPDEESRQWVERIAELIGARCIILKKRRSGDRSVAISGDELGSIGASTPVIVDDIASSANTMIEAVRLVHRSGLTPPVCVAVHAIFAGDAYERLVAAGPARVVSTNTVAHTSNAIDISAAVALAAREAPWQWSGGLGNSA